jgi:hypothetical protein
MLDELSKIRIAACRQRNPTDRDRQRDRVRAADIL